MTTRPPPGTHESAGSGEFAMDAAQKSPAHWQAWVDGTAAPNPGRIGLGLLLATPDGERRELSRLAGRGGCNNEAELLAIDAAMDAVLGAACDAGAASLTIHSDSRFAVDCLSGRDDTAIPRLASLLATMRARIGTFAELTLVWIPRHRNAEADRLARAALGLPPKASPERRRRR